MGGSFQCPGLPEAGRSSLPRRRWVSTLNHSRCTGCGLRAGAAELQPLPELPVAGRLCPPTVSLAVISHFWARCLSVNPSEKCAAHQRPCCGTSRKAFEHLYRGFSFSSHHSVLSDDCPRCVATLPCSNLALWSLAHQGEHLSLPLCAREASVSFLPSPFSSFPPALLLWWTLTASKLLTVAQSWLLPKWQLGTIIPKLGTSPAVDTEIYRCNRNHLQLSQCFPN